MVRLGIIVSVFSNIGKSSLKNYKNINYIDLDTCYFNKIDNWVNVYIECVLALSEKYDYVLLNAGGLTHTSVALADAIASCSIPVIEIHLSQVDQREDFRKINFIRQYCQCSFVGKGFLSYGEALDYIQKKEGDKK